MAMSIAVLEEKKLFLLSTDHMSYGMQVREDGVVTHLYWGAKLDRVEDLLLCEQVPPDLWNANVNDPLIRQEYQGAGGYFFDEPCLRVDYLNGIRDTKLFYDRYSITREENSESESISKSEIISKSESETLVLELKEELFPLRVRLSIGSIKAWTCWIAGQKLSMRQMPPYSSKVPSPLCSTSPMQESIV